MTDHQALLRECAADDALFHGPHTHTGGNVVDDGYCLAPRQKELMAKGMMWNQHPDGRIKEVFSCKGNTFTDPEFLMPVARKKSRRWGCFAVVAMLLFIVAMIRHLPWAKG